MKTKHSRLIAQCVEESFMALVEMFWSKLVIATRELGRG